MTDSRLRELERRWKETGSVEDEAAYLLERIRTGELDQSHLESGAMLGHPSACMALCKPIPEIQSWMSALEGLGPQAYIRAWLPIAQILFQLLSTRPFPKAEYAIKAATDWCLCPCNRHAGLARYAANESNSAANQTLFISDDCILRAAALVARLPDYQKSKCASETTSRLAEIRRLDLGWIEIQRLDPGWVKAQLLSQGWTYATEARLVREAVVPWLLGYSGPLEQERRITQ